MTANPLNTLPPDGAPLLHAASTAPFEPYATEAMTPEQERVYLASQWQLMWWKFRRHRLAVISAVVILAIYAMAAFAEFLAPYHYTTRNTDFIRAPGQSVHLFHEGSFIGPFVYPYTMRLNMENLKREYEVDRTRPQQLRFFCHGDDSYEFWGLIPGSWRLVCPPKDGTFFWLGSDRLGRDMLSRILYGGRISLSIGLLGISVSFVLGVIIGGIAGYYGGRVDLVVQRIIEIVQSLPHIPLWLALASIMPPSWSPLVVYFGITIILGLMDWTGLARSVRSKLLSLREEDYVVAAQLMGAKPQRIIGLHLIPGFMSHLIAAATITIPKTILGETALSFLGLGLRPPITSWGVMLNEAQNINVVALYPWLLYPVVPVILIILAFNFLGDGLRDAADPYR
ncbi:Peptide ABC transporter permease [Hyphomicrobiales bacterium]|nr:Peptide ABC transporter permease [Hyphomicrobiales bacterium]CAH1699059.1 Peptide ABC transporter permease [Hyphomicrobiales bacterium]CAI0342703.1 peptide/nickel transport system permease protein [Hyphomicrobiales bacterium]